MAQPLGLQQLISNKHLIVRQKTTYFKGNKYVIFDTTNKPILFAKEESSFLSLMGGKERAFNMQLCDENQIEVISLRRPYTFGPDKMEVSLCGSVVSVVRQKPTMMTPVLYINDAGDRPVLRIKGPIGFSGQCDFELQTANKQPIGVIQKKWGGLMKELFTDSDQFHIHFPMDLDVRFKAAVLGTCFLIDFLYYEH